jgi:hypothetical protein
MPANRALTMLVTASFLALAVPLADRSPSLVEASFRGAIARPFESIYSKTRNMGSRAIELLRSRSRYSSPYPFPVPSSAYRGPPPASNNLRSSRTRDTGDSSPSDDYKAMCVFSRGPSLKRAPALYYYSPEIKGNGCEVELEIELKADENYRQLDESFARASIQRKLIDTGYFVGTRPTYFLVHGFLVGWNGNWLCDSKDLILSKVDANVFIVDWSGGSKPMVPLDYGASVTNTQYVANLITQFIQDHLMPMSGQRDANSYHFIGHSLGAHISGFVGYSLGTVGQITGLDPAGPCFTTNSQNESQVAEDTGEMHKGKRRLSKESANFVMALHTDTKLFGLDENCAHYDVYVNSGSGQPGCGSISPLKRFEELLRMDVKRGLNFNPACSHSYSHQLLDSFVNFANWGSVGSGGGGQGQRLDACYPMAYKCAGWDAFRAGECGFCKDNDTHCAFTGISLYNHQVKKTESDELEYQGTGDDDDDDNDDMEFNDEDDEHEDDGDDDGDDRVGLEGPEVTKSPGDLVKRGQHFLKAAAKQPSCLFQYQILIAVRRSEDLRKHYYYLHIPLENSGLLHNDQNGNRLHDRLVQVSHKIKRDSPAYNNIKTTYLNELARRVDGAGLDRLRDELEFYSAMITFQQAPADKCGQHDDGSNGASTNKDKWQLCETLSRIRQARLWSSSSDKLAAVEWVALNYMSGLTFNQRIGESYALLRHPNEPIKERAEVDQADRAKLQQLRPRESNVFRRSTRGIAQAADCLLSLIDVGKVGNASRNYRCKRSSQELKYAVELVPKKLAGAGSR